MPSQYSPIRRIRDFLGTQKSKDNTITLKPILPSKEKQKLLKGLPKKLRKEDKFVFSQFLIKPKIYFSEQKGFALLEDININFTIPKEI